MLKLRQQGGLRILTQRPRCRSRPNRYILPAVRPQAAMVYFRTAATRRSTYNGVAASFSALGAGLKYVYAAYPPDICPDPLPMKKKISHVGWSSPIVALLACCLLNFPASSASAQKIRLKDGRILIGKTLLISGVADNTYDSPHEGAAGKSKSIRLIDDDLRRMFIPHHSVASVISEMEQKQIKINLSKWHNVAQAGGTLSVVGPSLGITSFDEWGRRIYRMQTNKGALAVVQGITMLTPRYAKVEGLRGQPRTVVWDMRLATSSIPRDVLAKILDNAVSKDDPQDWLKIVRFYLQTERYGDARRELEKIIRRFPDMKKHEDLVSRLQQLGAERILKEIKLRRIAGQHQLVDRLLANFPTEEVPGETLQQVRETLEAYAEDTARLKKVHELIKKFSAELGSVEQRKLLASIITEITTDLSRNNLERMAPFLQLADDESMSVEERLSLAISGWLLGAEGAKQDFSLTVSLIPIRKVLLEYLRQPLAHERLTMLQAIESTEGASVPDVAKLLMYMKPPWEIPVEAEQEHGAFEMMAPGKTEHGDFRYLVQLPPEYDPYRRYPTLLVLNGVYNTPEQELNFWAGAQRRDESGNVLTARSGQAMRHGYITIAVEWMKPQQHKYEYSLRECEAVLSSLRDATRRFSIDTDRVFLTGHGVGGNAAWDFAQSHPDMWAGVIPFVAKRDPVMKYIQHYSENAEYVSLYFVAGEKDGLKMSQNAELWDKYLRKRYDTTVVEYQGRGMEPFHDEILHIFDWMALPNHRRKSSPKQFVCKIMRPWDNYFWWIEGQEFPNPVYPQEWPLRRARPTEVSCRVPKPNVLWAKTTSARTTIWLSPKLVDFSKPIEIKFNGRKLNKSHGSTAPSLNVLLEDVRTRGDRIRPFWAKVEIP